MMKLTKRQLKNEITTLTNNIKVFETFVGDASEAKMKLAFYREQLIAINEAELRASLGNEMGK